MSNIIRINKVSGFVHHRKSSFLSL